MVSCTCYFIHANLSGCLFAGCTLLMWCHPEMVCDMTPHLTGGISLFAQLCLILNPLSVILIPWNPFHFIKTWTGKNFGEFNWAKSIFLETMLWVRPTSTLQHFEKECGILLAWGKCFNLLWYCFQPSWYVNYNLYHIQEPHHLLLRPSSFFFCLFSWVVP